MTETLLPPGALVLIVDSHPIIAAALELLAVELGAASSHIATNAASALAALDASRPSLAFLEFRPACREFAALVARLSALSAGIVLVSAYSTNELTGTAWEKLTAVEKPFTDSQIWAAVRKAVSGQVQFRQDG